jgi:hypothetical protein
MKYQERSTEPCPHGIGGAVLNLPQRSQLEKLLYWMEERQQVYSKRKAGDPPPWSIDPLFQNYRWCNVYREQDKVTEWIRTNWREPFAKHPLLWFSQCIARQINWPETLNDIGFPEVWDPKEVLRTMRSRVNRGQQVYSGAYMFTAGGSKGMDKPAVTVLKILNPLYEKAKKNPPPFLKAGCTLQKAAAWLEDGNYGFGPFLAYEVVTDLRHTRYLNKAPDIMTWANPGPGAMRGMNRLYKREDSPSREQLVEEMRGILVWLQKHSTNILPALEMRDVEHSLCEMQKYLRTEEQLKAGKRVTMDLYEPPKLTMF